MLLVVYIDFPLKYKLFPQTNHLTDRGIYQWKLNFLFSFRLCKGGISN